MTPTEVIRDAIDSRFATPASKTSRFTAMQLARGVVAALRAAGWIIVRHDAIALAQAHARDEVNDNKPTGYYVTEGAIRFVRTA